MPLLKIYQYMMRKAPPDSPHSYIPDDVVYRSPLHVGSSPPLEKLYPVIMRVCNEDRPECVKRDPYAVPIGYTVDNMPFAWNPRLVKNPLVLIVGVPGGGKSATVKTFIYNWLHNEAYEPEGKRHPPVIVVDPEGEYEVLRQYVDPTDVAVLRLGKNHYINLFDRPAWDINPFDWYALISQTLLQFLAVSPGRAPQAYRVFFKAVNEVAKSHGFTRDPSTWRRPDITLEEVYNWLETEIGKLEKQGKLSKSDQMFLQGATTLTTRLKQWMIKPFDAFSRRSTVSLPSLLDNYKLIILDCSGFTGTSIYNFFVWWLVQWFYGFMTRIGPLPSFGIRWVLVIDEAWVLLRKRRQEGLYATENPLEGLARRGRKYGLLLIVATQTPEDMDEKMFSLFGTIVVGSLLSERMVKKVVESRGMPKQFEAIIKSLERGLLVWHMDWAEKNFPHSSMPIIVKTLYPIRGIRTVTV